MDNVTFHKSKLTLEQIDSLAYKLWFQTTYYQI